MSLGILEYADFLFSPTLQQLSGNGRNSKSAHFKNQGEGGLVDAFVIGIFLGFTSVVVVVVSSTKIWNLVWHPRVSKPSHYGAY